MNLSIHNLQYILDNRTIILSNNQTQLIRKKKKKKEKVQEEHEHELKKNCDR